MLREQYSLQVWCLSWRRPRHVPRPDIPKQLQSCTRDARRERQPCPARAGVRDSVAQLELGPDHVWPCEVSGCYSWESQKAGPKAVLVRGRASQAKASHTHRDSAIRTAESISRQRGAWAISVP